MCGPFHFMQMICITLLSEGVPLANIKKENFNAMHASTKPVPPDAAQHTVTIRVENSNYQLTLQYLNSVLPAAKAANIRILYSCEAGSCIAACINGKIWMAYNDVPMDEEIEKGRILFSQSYPVNGDAEIVV